MRISVKVFDNRRYTGTLTVDGNESLQFAVSAMSDEDNGAPNVPQGTYRLSKVVKTPPDNSAALAAYGPTMLCFADTSSGHTIVIHGGELDDNGHLLATEGGLRLSNEDMEELVEMIGSKTWVLLDVREEHIGMLKKIGAGKVSNQVPYTALTPHNWQRPASITVVHDDDITDSPFFWMWLLDQNNQSQQQQQQSFYPEPRVEEWTAPSPDPLPVINNPFPSEAESAATALYAEPRTEVQVGPEVKAESDTFTPVTTGQPENSGNGNQGGGTAY